MPANGTQDEAGRFAPQNLVQSTRREGRIVIGQENPEHSRGQGGTVSDVIRLLAAVGADHVPQNVNPLDLPSVKAHPVKFFWRAVSIFRLAFWAQLGV